MKKKHSYICVDDGFRRKLKVESSLQGMSMIDYTRYLASKGQDLTEERGNEETKKRFKFSL